MPLIRKTSQKDRVGTEIDITPENKFAPVELVRADFQMPTQALVTANGSGQDLVPFEVFKPIPFPASNENVWRGHSHPGQAAFGHRRQQTYQKRSVNEIVILPGDVGP